VDANIAAAYKFPPPADNTEIQAPPMAGWLAKLESNAKQVTVSIDGVGSHGSGVIVAQQGSTYTVLTAYHVVACSSDSSGCQYTVTTHDGQQYSVVPSSIIRREGVDLAVVQFNSNTTYPRATLANYNPQNQDYVFVAGHPQRKDHWLWSGGRVYEKERGIFRVTKTALSEKASLEPDQLISVQAVSFDGGYELVYTSITYGGMSGGAVFDSQGRVIGIHGQAEGEREEGRDIQLGNSLGIPTSTVMGLLPQFQLTARQVNITEQPPQALTTEQLGNLENVFLSVEVPQTNASANVWIERGGQLLRLQRYGEAELAFEKAIQVATPAIEHVAHYGKGLALAEQGKEEAATQSLQTAVKVKPNYIPALYSLAVFYVRLEQYDKALAAIERAIEKQSQGQRQNAIFYYLKGVTLDELQRHAEALEATEKAINIAPRAAFYSNRGNIYLDLQQYDKALSDCDKAIQINPRFYDTYNNRGLAYAALQQHERAISDYTQVLQFNPKDAAAYNNLGNTYYSLQQYEKAILNYNKALEINPKTAIAYNNRGVTYKSLKQYEKAILDFTEVIRINPKDAEAYNTRGSTYRSLKQYEKAISDFNESLQINPKDALAYTLRGISHFSLQQYEKAIFDFNKVIESDLKLLEVYVARGGLTDNSFQKVSYALRGMTHFKLKQYEKAISDFTEVIESDTEVIEIGLKLPEFHTFRGMSYFSLQQHEKAISDFTEVIESNPKNALAYTGRGLSHYSLQQFEKAISDFTEALQINFKDDSAYISRGHAYFSFHKYEKAIADYNTALSINPKRVEAILSIGLIRYEQGSRDTAMRQFQKVLAINNISAEAKLALAVAIHQQGNTTQALELAKVALTAEPKFANPKYQRKNLWGAKLIADTQKLLSHPALQTALQKMNT
jgi:tetratricopeptide (TPR) repeat protein